MTRDLEDFGNAVRECLGLAPIYGRAHSEETRATEEQRFYIRPFREPGVRELSLHPLSHCRGRQ